MYQLPTLQHRMAELRIAQLHAEAEHARLVKEARVARRAKRGPSRVAGIVAALRGTISARGSSRRPAPRIGTRPATGTPCD